MPFKDPEAKRAWRAAYIKSQHAKDVKAAWERKRAADPAVAQREREAAAKRAAEAAERKRQREVSMEYSRGIRQSLALVSLRA